MKFCIFIPAYNAEKTILETLESVERSAEYSNELIDVYIQDDCSSDDTLNILNNYKSHWLNLNIAKNNENLKERKTTNNVLFGLSSKYDWTLLIHADDIVKPEWILEMKNQILISPANCFTVWSSYDSFNHGSDKVIYGDNTGNVEYNMRTKKDALFFLSKITASWHISGCALNLELFTKMGGFRENLAQYGDTIFFVDNILSGNSDIYIRKTLTRYRVITTSVSFSSKKNNSDVDEILFLINEYSELLDKKSKYKMLLFAIKMLLKRLLKNALKLDFQGSLIISNS
jgi:glycosyltransferase involved in cell wall biosynthesis